jgi:integrase
LNRSNQATHGPALREHLSLFVGPEAEALIFPGVKGGPLRRSNFNKMAAWPHAVHAIGAAGLHFHDLRHTGNQFAAASGASLKDLMARMGHDSEHAAIIYQHEARGLTWPSRARSTPTSRPSKPARASPATARRQHSTSPVMAR